MNTIRDFAESIALKLRAERKKNHLDKEILHLTKVYEEEDIMNSNLKEKVKVLNKKTSYAKRARDLGNIQDAKQYEMEIAEEFSSISSMIGNVVTLREDILEPTDIVVRDKYDYTLYDDYTDLADAYYNLGKIYEISNNERLNALKKGNSKRNLIQAHGSYFGHKAVYHVLKDSELRDKYYSMLPDCHSADAEDESEESKSQK